MSKSEGNIIDPVDLIDGIDADQLVAKRTNGLRQPEKAPQVEKETRKRYPDGFEAYGADALRFTLAAMSTKGRDINLSVERVAGYRNFGTKLWNATRFAQLNVAVFGQDIEADTLQQPINRWIVSGVLQCAETVSVAIEDYRFNDAADAVYRFVWDVVCDWYVELSKPLLQGEDVAARDETREVLGWTLEQIYKIMHPFSPFITETLWQQTSARNSFVMLEAWPGAKAPLWQDQAAAAEMDWVIRVISDIRSVRSDLNVPASAKVPVCLVGASDVSAARAKLHAGSIERLARLDSFSLADVLPEGAVKSVLGEATIGLRISDFIDTAAEIGRLDKQLGKLAGEITGLEKRLSNDSFVAKAPPEVVAEQRSRLEELHQVHVKVQLAREQLSSL